MELTKFAEKQRDSNQLIDDWAIPSLLFGGEKKRVFPRLLGKRGLVVWSIKKKKLQQRGKNYGKRRMRHGGKGGGADSQRQGEGGKNERNGRMETPNGKGTSELSLRKSKKKVCDTRKGKERYTWTKTKNRKKVYFLKS